MASGVKLDDKVVQEIARLVQAGKTGRGIAKALGLSESTIRPYVQQLKAGVAASTPSATPTASPAAPGTRTLEPHRLAALFPPMAESDYASFKADIDAHGVREAIWLYEGKILDGRNRYRACQELGIACPTRVYDGQEPLAFNLSLNLHRRQLNEAQRAMVAERLATLPEGRRANNSANLPSFSQGQAAKLLNVSTRSVVAAHKVRTEAQPEVVRAVEAGTMAVSAAATLAEKPVDVQRRVVNVLTSGAATSVPAALRKVAPAPAGPLTRAEAEFDRRLAQTGQYFAMVEQSKLIEGLGRRFAEEDVGRWGQALERLGAITKQLAARLLQACRERQ
jgi:ParB-like chromosome segregation protein Spo0J